MPKHKNRARGRPMAFFFYDKDYPDMRGIMEALKHLTGRKRAITILHAAARRMLRQEQERAAIMEQAMKQADTPSSVE